MNFYIISNSEQEDLKRYQAPYFLLKIDNWNDYNYRTQFGGVSKSMLKKSRLNFDKIEKCK